MNWLVRRRVRHRAKPGPKPRIRPEFRYFTSKTSYADIRQQGLKPLGPCRWKRDTLGGKVPNMAVAKTDHPLTTREVGELFGVDSKTVTRWANEGKLSTIRTLSGHRRYRAAQIHALFDVREWARIVDVTDTAAGIVGIRNQVGD